MSMFCSSFLYLNPCEGMKLLIFSLIVICVLKRIESDSLQDLLQSVTQLEEQLADEYKLAHAAAESWSNSINGVFPKALVNNKVCNKAGEYEKVVIEAQSKVKQYREVLQQTGQCDPEEFADLKNSVLHKIEEAKSAYEQAKKAFDRWHAGDRISVKDLLQAVTQLEKQLVDEYKLAHAATETWGDMIKGPIPEAFVHNKVCEKAGEYEEAVIEAQSEVKQYRELLQLTGYGDIEEFADLKRSVLQKTEEAKSAYEQAKKAYDSWRTGDRIESVKVKNLLQAITQLEEQLADEYKLAHAAAESWRNSIDGVFPKALVNNRVCHTARVYEKTVIEAQSEVKQYREVLQQTGQGDPEEFSALKRSVLQKIEGAKSAFEQANKAFDRWHAGDRINVKDVTQLEEQLADEYKLAHAAAETWGDMIKDPIPEALVHNKVCEKAGEYEEAVIEAQSEVKQYREMLQLTGYGDIEEFADLKRSVLQKIDEAKSGYEQAKKAYDSWRTGDRTESVKVKTLLQAVTQLEEQLADKYKLAHVAAESWRNMIEGIFPEALVHNKVCHTAHVYEKVVIEAQAKVKQYREVLQTKVQVKAFESLKARVLHKLEGAKSGYEQAKEAYDRWHAIDKIDSVKVKDLLQAVIQLEDQLAKEYKLAHVVAQTWTNCLKGTYRAPRVHILFNKVCQKAGEYKEAVIEAQSRVKQYREALEKTGQGDPKKFKALKRSVLDKIEKAKSAFEKAKKAFDRWNAGHRPLSYQVYEKRYVIGGVLRNAVAVFGLYALGNAFLGMWTGSSGDGQESQIPTAHTFGPIIKLGTPFASATLSTAASDTTRIVWIASMSIVVLVLLLGGWILWNRTYGSSKRRHL